MAYLTCTTIIVFPLHPSLKNRKCPGYFKRIEGSPSVLMHPDDPLTLIEICIKPISGFCASPDSVSWIILSATDPGG
jgi:hypothetical protein